MLETLLEDASHSEGFARKQLFESILHMASSPKELVDEIYQNVLELPKKQLWEVAVEFIRYIGYPENEAAIPILVEMLVDGNWPSWGEAVKTIKEIDVEKVVPFLIAIYLDQGKEREYWEDDVIGISLALVKLGAEYIEPCLPSLLLILAQEKLVRQLDLTMVLQVFDAIKVDQHQEYIPVFYNLYQYLEEHAVKQKILKLIRSYPKEVLSLYRNIFSGEIA